MIVVVTSVAGLQALSHTGLCHVCRPAPFKFTHRMDAPYASDAYSTGVTAASSIEHYLNPELDLQDAGTRLRAGKIVVLRDAFHRDFAEATHSALSDPSLPWTRNEAYFDDGYSFCHSNVHDSSRWPGGLHAALGVFDHPGTKQRISELSARDCLGAAIGSPSYYAPGDYSLPHSDWMGQRTVAYVWHLSKGWQPDWGGGLYWAQNAQNQRIYPASFNTLVLFLVTPSSSHFVTPVSRHAAGQRLTFNGWWQSSYLPANLDEDRLERMLSSREGRQSITNAQAQRIGEMLEDPAWKGRSDDAARRLLRLCDAFDDEVLEACGRDLLLRRLVRRS